jgi:cell division protease FtsH
MSDELGPRTFGQKEELVFLGREISEQRDYSDKVAEQIDDEVHKIIQKAHEVAKKILNENKPRLVYIAEKLVAQETLEGEELESALSKPVPTTPPRAKATTAPKPPTATAKTKAKPVVKKAPNMPQLHPKQAPATSD